MFCVYRGRIVGLFQPHKFIFHVEPVIGGDMEVLDISHGIALAHIHCPAYLRALFAPTFS
jgi:hypothetical protein